MTVELITTLGDIRIELFHRETPMTSRNFLELTKSGYYDGLTFHRVVPQFMCQTGDPFGDGSGGESIFGASFPDEIVANLSHCKKGMVSMANSGRDANSSQFFIIFRACPHLDGKHTVFGEVHAESLDVLDEFSALKTKNKKPLKPVQIFSATVLEDPWSSEPLPAECSIPGRPLVHHKGSKCFVQ